MPVVITAPNEWRHLKPSTFLVYLAGAIDMGQAVNWQQHVIDTIDPELDIALLNPRRAQFTPDTLNEQIIWELDALETSDAILMWFPATAQAPISLFETGLYMQSGKLFLGIEPGYYRERNLQLTADYYRVPYEINLERVIIRVLKAHTRWQPAQYLPR